MDIKELEILKKVRDAIEDKYFIPDEIFPISEINDYGSFKISLIWNRKKGEKNGH
jgi:hypothetical protein